MPSTLGAAAGRAPDSGGSRDLRLIAVIRAALGRISRWRHKSRHEKQHMMMRQSTGAAIRPRTMRIGGWAPWAETGTKRDGFNWVLSCTNQPFLFPTPPSHPSLSLRFSLQVSSSLRNPACDTGTPDSMQIRTRTRSHCTHSEVDL